MEVAVFAAGCFWGVEASFNELKGVLETEVGYTGGKQDNPTYEQVCTGQTGHAEVVMVKFDPNLISYELLLEKFWDIHDPTQVNRQGPDVGTQYRSEIFTTSQTQIAAAAASIAMKEKTQSIKIATKITPLETFHAAEEYHQKYFQKNPGRGCNLPI